MYFRRRKKALSRAIGVATVRIEAKVHSTSRTKTEIAMGEKDGEERIQKGKGKLTKRNDIIVLEKGKGIGGSRGRRRRVPLRVPILSFRHTKFSKHNRLESWRPPLRGCRPLWEILDPPLKGDNLFGNICNVWTKNGVSECLCLGTPLFQLSPLVSKRLNLADSESHKASFEPETYISNQAQCAQAAMLTSKKPVKVSMIVM